MRDPTYRHVRPLTAPVIAKDWPRLSNGVKIERRASASGTRRGAKPADNVPASVNHGTDDRASLTTYADARNLCLKRREVQWVKVADTPDPKWEGGGRIGSNIQCGLLRSPPGV